MYKVLNDGDASLIISIITESCIYVHNNMGAVGRSLSKYSITYIYNSRGPFGVEWVAGCTLACTFPHLIGVP